jgi:high-affinity nickel-transport protein
MDVTLLSLGLGGSLGVLGGALALGIRHGIDWDHIAAITDITSTTSSSREPHEGWLIGEPGVTFTDESDHVAAEMARRRPVAGGSDTAVATVHSGSVRTLGSTNITAVQRRAIYLASLYAVGHGTVVTILGLLALLASQFLPSWIDPVMERVVGVTLVLLGAYLCYSLVQYFRGKAEFRLRSRWMLIFAGVRNMWTSLWARIHGHRHEHVHVHGIDQYGPRTAYMVGMIHGVGAETGTQVLIIATAVGAGTKVMGVAALFAFVIGVLISNSFVTIATTFGFVSARRRQLVYVGAGLFAAVFSLAVGVIFLFAAGGMLPDLGQYFSWLGGPNS